MWIAASAAVVSFAACQDEGTYPPLDDDGHGTGALAGEECASTDECADDLVCAGIGVCLEEGEPGTAGEGEECASSEYCEIDLVCAADGTCAVPGDPGTQGHGENCVDDGDCQAGLDCVEGGCYGVPIPLWNGVDCSASEGDDGEFRVYFEVPDGAPLTEFFRLPFPNDARVVDGRLDLDGFPGPGAAVEEFGDVVGSWVEAFSEDFDGWGPNQTVYLRLSDRVDWTTAVLGDVGIGTVLVVDVTEGAEEYGQRHGVGFRGTGSTGRYICGNSISIDPSDGRPYLPGHTYAAVITSGLRQYDSGAEVAQDADFAAMMVAIPPQETRLQRAWEVYEPLREWAADAGLDPEQIAGAAVFTIADVDAPARAVREAVAAASLGGPDGLHLCQAGEDGPYADPGDSSRGCHGEDAAFHEIQGTLEVLVVQQGTPPYKTAADGGGVTLDAGGGLVDAGTEDVVFALTVPRGEAMPASGWPVVIVAHEAGGNYRSFVENGLAEALSDVELDDGTHVRFAVLGLDGVLHGPRAHPENWDATWLDLDPRAYDPDPLFFNALNGRATRDNPLQAVADGIAAVRMVQGLSWDENASPTGERVALDADRIYLLGHGQGAATAVPLVAHEPDVAALVLSSAGGLLIESMLSKERPVRRASVLEAALADPDLDRWHPALNLLQGLAGGGDAVNHAALVQREPPDGWSPRHCLQTYAADDGYTPAATQEALALALYLDQVTNGYDAVDGLQVQETPVSGNQLVDGSYVTGILALYEPNGGADGHDVVFDLSNARRQVTHFLATAVRDGTPTVVVP